MRGWRLRSASVVGLRVFWPLFFVVAGCFVGMLILLDNWERIQVWARRRFAAPVTVSGARVNGFGSSRAKVTVSAPAQTITPSRTDLKSDKGRLMGRYLGGIASFLLRRPLTILFLAGFVVIAVAISGCVPDWWGKSKDTLRAERDSAMIDKTVAEHEADMGHTAVELAEETHADTARVRAIVERADEELEDAVELADFDALWSAYDRAYRGVWSLDAGEDFPNPPAGRPDSLRGAGADLA